MKRASLAVAAPFLAAALVAALAPPAAADVRVATAFEAGPSNGDESTFKSVDVGSGTVTIFQRNTRTAGTVHCVGEGPRATLAMLEAPGKTLQKVTVAYADALMTEHPVIDVLVTGADGRVLGHKAAFGPKYYESGTIDVPLFAKNRKGEQVRVLIGLQVHAGCLPHPLVLGLAGSRPVEGARVSFPSVTLS
ncbi:MAG: hypothetical protein ACT4QG_19230 [Sporichthyaceae bacterium]